MMSSHRVLVLVFSFELLFTSAGLGQNIAPISPMSLFGMLCNPDKSKQAVQIIKSTGTKYVPFLLKWTKDPPKIDGALMGTHRVGLADAFGELRVKESIPFLLRYIDMNRELGHPMGMGDAESKYQEDLDNKPAMTALIKIGEIDPLIKSYYLEKLTWNERDKLFRVICEMAELKSKHALLEFKSTIETNKKRIDEALARVDESTKKDN